jgi:hypothetical protein
MACWGRLTLYCVDKSRLSVAISAFEKCNFPDISWCSMSPISVAFDPHK